MAIGKIKRQKQRPSVDRLYNVLSRSGGVASTLSKDNIQALIDDMIGRQLLEKVINAGKDVVSYREKNSAIAIVAINNPIKTRVHLVPDNRKFRLHFFSYKLYSNLFLILFSH